MCWWSHAVITLCHHPAKISSCRFTLEWLLTQFLFQFQRSQHLSIIGLHYVVIFHKYNAHQWLRKINITPYASFRPFISLLLHHFFASFSYKFGLLNSQPLWKQICLWHNLWDANSFRDMLCNFCSQLVSLATHHIDSPVWWTVFSSNILNGNAKTCPSMWQHVILVTPPSPGILKWLHSLLMHSLH